MFKGNQKMKTKEERKKIYEAKVKQRKPLFRKKVDEERLKHPELDIDVNIMEKNTNIIRSMSVYAEGNKFKYDGTTYKLNPKRMILQPTKDSFRPFYMFKEGNPNPIDFENKNKRIPSRVLTLLYNLDTYRILIVYENKNLNLILVIIGVITLILLVVYGWLNFLHGQLPNIPFING
jgi:hypothetical protein